MYLEQRLNVKSDIEQLKKIYTKEEEKQHLED